MKALRSVLLTLALFVPCSASAMSFVVAQSDPHPRTRVIGELVAVTPMQMVVATPYGQVPLLIDSRTVVPSDLALGNTIAVEFRVLDNGSALANRVVPYRGELPGNEAISSTRYEEAVPTDESVAVVVTPATTYAAPAQYEAPESDASVGGDTPAVIETDEANQLPRTASARPLLGVSGALALAAAATLAVVRRRRLA